MRTGYEPSGSVRFCCLLSSYEESNSCISSEYMFGDCGRVSVMDGVVTVLAWFRAPGPILKTIVLFNCGRLVLVSFLSPTYTHRSYPNGKAQDQENEPSYEESGLSTRHRKTPSHNGFPTIFSTNVLDFPTRPKARRVSGGKGLVVYCCSNSLN
jgi:hypothetical protein